MNVSVRRLKSGAGPALRVRAEARESTDYDQTIHPGESALGFTYEEWDVAVGTQSERRIELAEDGSLRPELGQSDSPADGHE